MFDEFLYTLVCSCYSYVNVTRTLFDMNANTCMCTLIFVFGISMSIFLSDCLCMVKHKLLYSFAGTKYD